MKTHEFARQLELMAKWLRKLPDMEVDPKSLPNLQPSLPGLEGDDSIRESKSLPKGIEEKLSRMSAAELEAFLTSEEQALTTANLVELSERIGLQTSKRQNKNALVNLIVRHYEAGQMHSIIRSARQEMPAPTIDIAPSKSYEDDRKD